VSRKMLIVMIAFMASFVGATTAQAAPPAASAPIQRRTTSLAWVTEPGQITALADAPQPVTWGWCGVITPEKKLIRMFKKKGGTHVPLYCGGPKYSFHPTWGLRHIVQRHEVDWERKAFGTHQGWRELVDISVDAVLRNPDVAGKERGGKRCFSRHVYLWDYERDQVVDFMTVKVVFLAHGSHKIITAYPATNNCDL
jgi:hypothetical protein